LCVLPRDAAKLERHLFERGVIVRPMGGYGLPRTLRISVGTRAENRRLLRAIASFPAAGRTKLPSPVNGGRWPEGSDGGL
jgi:histidinol-phosphate/aromatic aminotransferase/cobyric acid decarboxylase-like protein